MTINQTWAYNANDRAFKSTTELIRTLIEVASRGGNLLLNVGPMPDGTIQPEFQERLLAIGTWLKANGEAIYGTTYGPLQKLPFARTTAKDGTIYLHVFDWPAQGPITVPGVGAKIRRVRLLAGNRPLEFRQQSDVLTVQSGGLAPDPHATVLALDTR
jgi:alpha-L-fucosidase